MHYSIDLSTLGCDFYELTDVKGGETYRRFPVAEGDVILGDRGYCHREGVAHVVKQKGDVVVRLNSTNFPLLTRKGDTFHLLAHLRELRDHTSRGWKVAFEASGRQFSARLCAVRKSRFAADREKKKIEKENKRKKIATNPETLECAEYVFVLTTLDEATVSASEVLSLYRMRWQIELVFKRMKTLMRLCHLPKRTDASSRAWIEGKLLTVLLIERLLKSARFFPRGDSISIRRSRWREFIEARDSVLSVVVPALPPSVLLDAAPRLGPRLAERTRTRLTQASNARSRAMAVDG